MIKAPIELRDLRQRIYVKEKAEPSGNTGREARQEERGVGRGKLLWAASERRGLPKREREPDMRTLDAKAVGFSPDPSVVRESPRPCASSKGWRVQRGIGPPG